MEAPFQKFRRLTASRKDRGANNISRGPYVKGCGCWFLVGGRRKCEVDRVLGDAADLYGHRAGGKVEPDAFPGSDAAGDPAESFRLEIGIVLDDVDPAVGRDRHDVES